MRKPIKIGQKEYKFKKEAIAHYRAILNSYDFGQSLNKDDFNDLIDLLTFGNDNIINLETDLDNSDSRETFVFDKKQFKGYEVNTLEDNAIRYIKCPTTKTTVIDYENATQLIRDINLLKGERFFCIIDGNFIFGDIIEAFLIERHIRAKELTISTLSMSEENVDSLAGLLDYGYVDKLNLIISDHFFAYERDNLVEYIYEQLDIENKFQLTVCNNKSKIILIEVDYEEGRKYVIHGSADFNSSNTIEQFSIEENEDLFDFNKNILNGIIEKFKTIDKSAKQIENNTLENIVLDGRASFNDFFEEELVVIDIKVSQVQFSTKCFEVFYSDDSSQYISYLMLINNTKYTPEKLFYVACRNSIHSDIRSVKQAYFDKNSIKGQVKCQETNILSTWTELAVDHRQPNTFSIIVDRFKEVNNFELDTIEYTSNENNHIVFKDEKLANDFRKYHMEKASLRIVRTECNSSRTGMARLKRTSKDLTIDQNIS